MVTQTRTITRQKTQREKRLEEQKQQIRSEVEKKRKSGKRVSERVITRDGVDTTVLTVGKDVAIIEPERVQRFKASRDVTAGEVSLKEQGILSFEEKRQIQSRIDSGQLLRTQQPKEIKMAQTGEAFRPTTPAVQRQIPIIEEKIRTAPEPLEQQTEQTTSRISQLERAFTPTEKVKSFLNTVIEESNIRLRPFVKEAIPEKVDLVTPADVLFRSKELKETPTTLQQDFSISERLRSVGSSILFSPQLTKLRTFLEPENGKLKITKAQEEIITGGSKSLRERPTEFLLQVGAGFALTSGVSLLKVGGQLISPSVPKIIKTSVSVGDKIIKTTLPPVLAIAETIKIASTPKDKRLQVVGSDLLTFSAFTIGSLSAQPVKLALDKSRFQLKVKQSLSKDIDTGVDFQRSKDVFVTRADPQAGRFGAKTLLLETQKFPRGELVITRTGEVVFTERQLPLIAGKDVQQLKAFQRPSLGTKRLRTDIPTRLIEFFPEQEIPLKQFVISKAPGMVPKPDEIVFLTNQGKLIGKGQTSIRFFPGKKGQLKSILESQQNIFKNIFETSKSQLTQISKFKSSFKLLEPGIQKKENLLLIPIIGASLFPNDITKIIDLKQRNNLLSEELNKIDTKTILKPKPSISISKAPPILTEVQDVEQIKKTAQAKVREQQKTPLFKTSPGLLPPQAKLKPPTRLLEQPRPIRPSPRRTFILDPISEPKVVLTPEFKLDFELPTQKNLVQGFDVQVRRGGQFETIQTGATLSEGLESGSERVRNTAAATFRLIKKGFVEGKKAPFNIDQFANQFRRGKKGEFIERKKFRISTPGELKEITFAPRKKKKNGFFDFGFF